MSELITEVILTIHGVESRGEWQLQVTPEFGGIDGLVHDPYTYGRFAFWRVLVPLARNREIKDFYRKLDQVQKLYPDVRPSVIAHSFGTYIVSRTLAQYPSIKLDRLILCGSIIDKDFDWENLLGSRRVLKVRNEVAGGDRVVGLFRWQVFRLLVPHSGPSGVESFGKTVVGLEEPVFSAYRHSSYFVANSHCRVYWLPFLRGTGEFSSVCEKYLSGTDEERAAAANEFRAVYEPAIRAAIEQVFSHRTVSEEQLTDYFKIVRHNVVREGRKASRKFDELVHRYTLALLKNVSG